MQVKKAKLECICKFEGVTKVGIRDWEPLAKDTINYIGHITAPHGSCYKYLSDLNHDYLNFLFYFMVPIYLLYFIIFLTWEIDKLGA